MEEAMIWAHGDPICELDWLLDEYELKTLDKHVQIQ